MKYAYSGCCSVSVESMICCEGLMGPSNLPQYEGEFSVHSIAYVMDSKMESLAFVPAGRRYLKRKYIAQFQSDGQSET